MGIAEEIEKLNSLRQNGVITDEEYEEAKASLLVKNRMAGQRLKQSIDGFADTNMWGMCIHLSQFCGYIIPFAGLIVPILLWQIKKNDADIIDQHGRIVVNWIITEFILGLIFALLCFILIGFPLLFVLAAVAVIFPIIGGIKANNGEVWRYPCSINFFKTVRH